MCRSGRRRRPGRSGQLGALFYGSRSGLRLSGADVIRGDEDLLLLRFGEHVTFGNFDGGGRPELAASAPWNKQIRVYAVDTSGVRRDQTRISGTDQPSLLEAIRFESWVGEQRSAGDTNRDAKDELVAAASLRSGSQASLIACVRSASSQIPLCRMPSPQRN